MLEELEELAAVGPLQMVAQSIQAVALAEMLAQ
jgi:hypothetical protein